ncbi:MAG: efflux transporter outer membrane subunit [Steroidobacteraceae bacterium]
MSALRDGSSPHPQIRRARTATPAMAAMGITAGWVALVAVVLLAGCATTGGLAPQARVRSVASLGASQTLSGAKVGGVWPSQDWWTAFGDPQLDRLIEEGLAGSPSLKEAEARTRLALAAARVADAARLPQVGLAGASTRELFPGHYLIPPPYAGTWSTANELSLSLGYSLDFWGKYRSAYEQSLDASRAAALDAEAARVALSTAIAHAYVAMERAYLERGVEQTLLAERTQIYSLTRERSAAGIDSMVDVKQARSALPDARERITQLDETIGLSRDALAALIGAGPDRGRALERPQLVALPAPALPTRLPAELLGRRPDILALRWRIESARHGIASAKADFYPDVNLAALAGFAALGTGALFTAANREIGVGPALSLPIFYGGRLRGNLAGRDAEYDIAVAQYNQALSDALRDVADQLVSLRSIAGQRTELGDGLATAQDAYDLALQRYRGGVGNYLQVLATHEALLAQRQLDVELRARAWDVSIDLVGALGGGYVPTRADEPPAASGPRR